MNSFPTRLFLGSLGKSFRKIRKIFVQCKYVYQAKFITFAIKTDNDCVKISYFKILKIYRKFYRYLGDLFLFSYAN